MREKPYYITASSRNPKIITSSKSTCKRAGIIRSAASLWPSVAPSLLTGTSLRALDIDFLAVLDKDMNVVVGYMINEIGGEVPLSNKVLKRLRAVGSQFLTMEPGASDSGSEERSLSPH